MSDRERFDDAAYRDDGPDLPPLAAEEEARLRTLIELTGRSDAEAPPDPGFRRSLRERFVMGSLDEPAPVTTPAFRPVVVARPPRVIQPWVAGLAAAALLAVAVFAWLPGPAPKKAPAGWTVVAATVDSTVSGETTVRIDGRDLLLATLQAGGTPIAPGARVELPAGVGLELVRGDVLRVATTPGAVFTLPTADSADVATGEMRFVTGPGFAGTRLAVTSPQARIEVTGTSFVVIAAPAMTCVCVGEGTVRVSARDGSGATMIPAGHRREIYDDGTMSEELVVHGHEAAALEAMRAAMEGAVSPRR